MYRRRHPAGTHDGAIGPMHVFARLVIAGVGAALLIPGLAAGADKPLWEVGAGVAPISFPTYPGSGKRRSYVLPIPYVVYRGDLLKVDRSGARGLLWNSDRARLSVSVDGAVPVDSRDNGPRAGMDDLDPVFEIGPSLKVKLLEMDSGTLGFRLPLRAAVAIGGGSVRRVGWKSQPVLNYNAPKLLGQWNIGVQAGPKFASSDYHGYYYNVGARDARPDRPIYNADGGYSGFGATLSASRRFDRFWVGSFLRYDQLDGAAFDDSPLVKSDHAISVGFAVSWIFWQSERTVSVGDDVSDEPADRAAP